MIALINYQAGNTRSVQNALRRLGVESVVTDEAEVIRNAEHVIFPGVGEAGSAMAYLQEKELDRLLPQLTQPFLGICLGLQLMCRHSEEGDVEGLGIFDLEVKHFPPKGTIPHMGWNNFQEVRGSLFEGLSPAEDMYFVHSYYAETGPDTVAITDYLLPFSAALARDNFMAVQFHPEKSAKAGRKLLQNFLSL